MTMTVRRGRQEEVETGMLSAAPENGMLAAAPEIADLPPAEELAAIEAQLADVAEAMSSAQLAGEVEQLMRLEFRQQQLERRFSHVWMLAWRERDAEYAARRTDLVEELRAAAAAESVVVEDAKRRITEARAATTGLRNQLDRLMYAWEHTHRRPYGLQGDGKSKVGRTPQDDDALLVAASKRFGLAVSQQEWWNTPHPAQKVEHARGSTVTQTVTYDRKMEMTAGGMVLPRVVNVT
jgi:hypothetical protein